MSMNLLNAAKRAQAELERLHTTVEPCDGTEKCPGAVTIRELRDAIKREETETPMKRVIIDRKARTVTAIQRISTLDAIWHEVPNCAP